MKEEVIRFIDEAARNGVAVGDAEVARWQHVFTQELDFLNGRGVESTYCSSSWTPYCDSFGQDLNVTLDNIRAGLCSEIHSGQLFDKKRRKYVPNQVGLFPEANMAVKVGGLSSLFDTATALNFIGNRLSHLGIQANRAGIFQLNGTQMGMMVSPLIKGDLLQRHSWNNFPSQIKLLLMHELRVWLETYSAQIQSGRTFYDVTEAGNTKRDTTGELVIIDASTRVLRGKSGKDGGGSWLSGEIVELILHNAQFAGVNLAHIGITHLADEKKLHLCSDLL